MKFMPYTNREIGARARGSMVSVTPFPALTASVALSGCDAHGELHSTVTRASPARTPVSFPDGESVAMLSVVVRQASGGAGATRPLASRRVALNVRVVPIIAWPADVTTRNHPEGCCTGARTTIANCARCAVAGTDKETRTGCETAPLSSISGKRSEARAVAAFVLELSAPLRASCESTISVATVNVVSLAVLSTDVGAVTKSTCTPRESALVLFTVPMRCPIKLRTANAKVTRSSRIVMSLVSIATSRPWSVSAIAVPELSTVGAIGVVVRASRHRTATFARFTMHVITVSELTEGADGGGEHATSAAKAHAVAMRTPPWWNPRASMRRKFTEPEVSVARGRRLSPGSESEDAAMLELRPSRSCNA
jgi:hypothetical protein